MQLSEYARLDATALAALVRRGETTPEELARTALAAIAATNGAVNAVVETYADEVWQSPADGPFRGVPFLRKDILIEEEGRLSEFGSRLAAGLRMPGSSELMLRFRRAGLVTVGRTTTPEMAFNATTENVHHGPTRNPWNIAHSSGGSSGGAGAAVAAGMVPMAHGNDGGGSIRIPAAACGLVGLKPTRGRVSLGPNHGTVLLGLVAEHVLTRSVRDSAAMLDCIAGPAPGDPYDIAPPSRPFAQEVGADPGRLRIAFTKKTFAGAPIDPQLAGAVERTARLCASLGHEVSEAAPAVDMEALNKAKAVLWCAFLAHGARLLAAVTGREVGPDTMETTMLACVEYGRACSAIDLYAADDAMNAASRQAAPFFAAHDVLLTPTIGRTVARLGELDANAANVSGPQWVEQVFAYVPFTALFNATGQPAISLPLAMDAGGLPIGLQFVGPMGGEGLLFRLAAQLEQAAPWADRRPAMWAGDH